MNVREANGGPMPAKVTVLCTNGPCAVTHRSLVLYTDVLKDPAARSDRPRRLGGPERHGELRAAGRASTRCW